MTLLYSFLAQVAVIASLSLIERYRTPGKTDWLRNLQCWAIDIGVAFTVVPLLRTINYVPLIDAGALPFVVAFLIFLFVRDGLEFFFHLCQHKIGFLWRMHSLHHSDPEMAALTTTRHFWGDRVIKALTIWPITSAIIGETDAILAAYALVTLYNYFIHAKLKVDFGRWSWVLNCPAYHRRHHSKLREHFDSNFAALFPIFDVICGTYRRPDGWPPTGQDVAPHNIGDVIAWPLVTMREPERAEAG